MSERDTMALLAEANPVRAGELPLDVELVDRIVKGRQPSRRTAVVGAIALAALAASFAALFAVDGRRPGSPHGFMLSELPAATVAHPLGGAPEVTVAQASAAIGQPIVLPDTSFVSPSDAGHAWVSGTFPNVTAAVNFPTRGLFIEYTAPPPLPDMSASYQAIARQNPHGFETVELHGETALAVKQNTDDTGHNFGGVVFVLNGLEISVFGHYGTAALQSIAQSIFDQEASQAQPLGVGTPPTIDHPLSLGAKRVSLSDATSALGAPIVQPDTAVVNASDAGAVWTSGSAQSVAVAVTYPGADVWVRYSRPLADEGGYGDRLAGKKVTILDGVPTQVFFHDWTRAHWRGFYPSVEFAAGGTDVAVIGHQSKTTLEAIARSIIDRSAKPPAGQLGDVEAIQVYPYLPSARQIALADASSTLGAPVALPGDPSQAWAEGTCPHPDAAPGSTEFCAVWVSFRGSSLSVGYVRPPQYVGTRGEWKLSKRLGRSAHVLNVDGVPALAIDRDRAKGYPGRISFDLDGNRVVVAGDYATARLRAVARSIVDRYPMRPGRATITRAIASPSAARPLGPGAKRVALAGAASTFGGRVVLPRSAFVRPADVGQVWSAPRALGVTFPGKGLIIRYERPAPSDPLASFEDYQRGSGGRASVVLLNGGWALEKLPARKSGWSSLTLVAKGALVSVLERGSTAHLRHVANSILERSRR
jgi:hypothetical protein